MTALSTLRHCGPTLYDRDEGSGTSLASRHATRAPATTTSGAKGRRDTRRSTVAPRNSALLGMGERGQLGEDLYLRWPPKREKGSTPIYANVSTMPRKRSRNSSGDIRSLPNATCLFLTSSSPTTRIWP